MTLAGHADQHHPAPGPHQDSASVIEAALPTQSNTTSAPSVSRPAEHQRPAARRRTARANWSGGTTWSAPSEAASSRWRACLAPTMTVHGAVGRTSVVEGGDGGEPQGAGAHHGHQVTVGDVGRQGGVHRTGGRFDHDGVLVGQCVGYGVQLAGVGHQRCGRPTAAGVGAVAGLQSGARGPRRRGCRTGRCGLSRTRRRAGGCGGGRSRAPAR